MRGPPGAGASSTSTASSAARRTSTTRRSTREQPPSRPEQTPEEGYHFTEDMTDKAITWIRQQKSLMPDRPFFIYYAPGATTPAPRADGEEDGYKGRLDEGWDALRRRCWNGRRSSGRAAETELTTGARRSPAWDDRPDGMKPVSRGRSSLRRLPRARRPPLGPTRGRARGPECPRGHARLLQHRRRRRVHRRRG